MEHKGIINAEGKFIPNDSKYFIQDFADRKNREVVLKITYEGETATEKQINFYYSAIVKSTTNHLKLQDIEWNDNKTHLLLSGLFLPENVCIGNFIVPSVRTISSLKKQEMVDFIEKCKDFMFKHLNIIVE